ncbi:MAG TPA: NHLP family bacteriocin export ABC transporter peptidase/permease/ATPase subunit [Stellaceae bacterium]|nr:NHLP family bacteriocin export ABC transporter peptidase/permease/ATPase subunit [Stellaceae bacterium]
MSEDEATGPSLLRRILAALVPWRGPRIRRTPTILQMEAVECGAASLAIILAYHGIWVPLEQLRVACGVSRDGSKASNVVKAARGFGLAARGFKKEPSTLGDIPMPCIIHWNFNHFLVLEGLSRDRAYLNDPAEGRRRVTMQEFGESFTGVVLALEPGENFRKSGHKPAVFSVLARVVRRSKRSALLLLLVSASLVVPGIVIPAFSKIFVDDILIGGARGWLTPLLIGMAATALARMLITTLQQSLLLRLQTKIAVTMISRFFWHVMSLPIEFFNQRHAGDIAGRVGANERVARLLSGAMATNALDLVSLIFFAAAMAAYDTTLAALGVGMSVLNVVAVTLVSRRRDELNRGLAVERGKLNGSTVGIIRTIETLKAGGLEDDAFSRWAGYQALVLNSEQKLGLYAAFTEIFPPLFAALTTAVILGIGGLRVIDGALTIGGLVAFQSLMVSFSTPITTLVQLAGSFLTIKGDLARIEDVFNYPLDPPVSPRAGMAPKLSGHIQIEDLRFQYSPLEPPLIDGFSLTIEPGMRIALVGASGSGKSTIGRLLTGLCRPTGGEIRFDGVPLPEVPADLFAGSVAYIDQDVFLFEGTVRENVTLWDPEVPEADITRALRDAAIQDEIAIRPGNYDSYVSEGGTNFSGGQRQRIEIARAFVGNPSVLVLDEATAALDPTTEKQIDDNLRRRGCTCVIIAHRLSTIRDCDEILLLDQGKVIESGTHDDLIRLDGAYARLVALA